MVGGSEQNNHRSRRATRFAATKSIGFTMVAKSILPDPLVLSYANPKKERERGGGTRAEGAAPDSDERSVGRFVRPPTKRRLIAGSADTLPYRLYRYRTPASPTFQAATPRHSTARHSTAQHGTPQYSAAEHSRAEPSAGHVAGSCGEYVAGC